MASKAAESLSNEPEISEAEWELRLDLAACYRIIAHYGWDDLIFTHISARVPGPGMHFLINPFGLMFEEITASSLLKVDLDGNIVTPSDYLMNPAGFVIHSAIHAAREDAHCVLHTHSISGQAVSAQEGGLLPITQTALSIISDLGYHDYEGIVFDAEEKERLLPALGDKHCLILKNHGLMTVGHDVASAFMRMYFLQRACEAQLGAQSGAGAVVRTSDQAIERVHSQTETVMGVMAPLGWQAIRRKLDREQPDYKS